MLLLLWYLWFRPDYFYFLLLYLSLLVERFRFNDFGLVEARVVAGNASIAVLHILANDGSDRLRTHLNVVHLAYVEIDNFVQRIVKSVVL